MEEVKLNLDAHNQGAFVVIDNGEQLGEMVIAITAPNLTVYHTAIVPKAEGRGLAKILLNQMVSYAREHRLKIIPLCPYVHVQFKRHPQEFEDVWNKTTEDQ